MWQSSNNAKSSAFRNALIELYSDSISDLTQKLLLIRRKQGLFTDKVAGFNSAIWLYSIRAAVSKCNTVWLCDLLQLVVVIKSVDISVSVWKATLNQCNTIDNLALYIGVEVMLI